MGLIGSVEVGKESKGRKEAMVWKERKEGRMDGRRKGQCYPPAPSRWSSPIASRHRHPATGYRNPQLSRSVNHKSVTYWFHWFQSQPIDSIKVPIIQLQPSNLIDNSEKAMQPSNIIMTFRTWQKSGNENQKASRSRGLHDRGGGGRKSKKKALPPLSFPPTPQT